MTTEVVLTASEGAIAVVTLNRPAALNAVTIELARGIVDVITDLGGHADVGAIVVTGAGRKAFCVGADLKHPPVTPGDSEVEYLAAMRTVFDMGACIRSCPKPVVAAVNGYAIGGGFDLALACDFRVAASTAVFGAGYIQVGLIPGDGGTYYLPRLVGEARAKQIFMLGDRFSAQDAFGFGLLHSVVEPDDLVPAAVALGTRLASYPALAMSSLKQLINESFEVTAAEAMHHVVAAQRACLVSPEYTAAARAFVHRAQGDGGAPAGG